MKKKLRSMLILVLTLAVLLSLAACGSKEEDKEEEEHPDVAYVAETITVKSDLLTDGLSPAGFTENGFYGTSYGKIGEREPEEGEIAEYEGQFDINGYKLFFVSYDGNVKQLSGYRTMEAESDPGDKLSFYSGTNFESLFLDQNGEIVTIESVYSGWFDGTEEEMYNGGPETWDKYRSASEYYLRRLDENGAEKSRVRLDFDVQDTWLDFSRTVYSEKGDLFVCGGDGIYSFAMDGSLRFVIKTETMGIWPNSLVKLKDGSIAVSAWQDMGGIALYPVNLEKKTLDKPLEIPENAYNPTNGDERFDFYYVNGMYLYGYNLETKEETKVLNWLDVDVNGDRISGFKVQPDGSIVGVLNQWKNDRVTTEIVKIHEVPYDSIPHKETLKLAVLYGGDMYDKVIDFNRHNDSVRIQLVDYSEFNDAENDDYDAGRTKLLTEIMSGTVPDILALNQLPYKQLAAKGILEDLYPYLDKDPELKRSDFFPNVLKAMEVNGGLYEITDSFNVTTLVGATQVVGEKPGWTYKDLQAALATMPEDCAAMDMYTTRDDLLQTLLSADMDHYVDWNTGKCSFDSQDFLELLAFVKQFPASIPDDMEWESPSVLIAAGRQMLTSAYIYSVDDMLWNDAQFGPGGCTYIGYPTNNGVGSVMDISSSFGISTSCKNKDAAWQFLRTYLTEEGQENVWSIPIRLDSYQKLLDEAMTPDYYTDENGHYLLDEDGKKIEIPRYGYTMEDGTEINIYALTQEQADKLWEAITTCTKVRDYNTSILEIVQEQAQAYFAGQKSAEEVAKLIQSKANIYVNEQR